jgi:DNA-binding transcriptional MerR regulator
MSAANAQAARTKTAVASAAADAESDARPGSTWSISDLAQEFALTTRAIRFYEDEGLLKPERHGTRRVYGARERTRLKLILRGKRLGLSLVDIKEILDLYDSRAGDRAQLAKFLEALERRRLQLHQQREDIDVVLAEILALEKDCRRRLGRLASAPPARTPAGEA